MGALKERGAQLFERCGQTLLRPCCPENPHKHYSLPESCPLHREADLHPRPVHPLEAKSQVCL